MYLLYIGLMLGDPLRFQGAGPPATAYLGAGSRSVMDWMSMASEFCLDRPMSLEVGEW
jgi:hypothetical protein